MIFITLIKWKKTPSMRTQDDMDIEDKAAKMEKEWEKQGNKLKAYWTLGRYDAVWIIEAQTEKEAMKGLLVWQNFIETETMVAIPREEAIKLL